MRRTAPMAAPDGGVIEVMHGRGHGHKHRERGRNHEQYRAAVITSISITDKPSLDSLIVIPLPGRYANCSGANGSRPRGAAGSAIT